MSPFLIFAIVLTIGYVLYYAALITMDLNAKPKSGANAEENIVVGDTYDDQEEYKPKTVVENAEAGGFSFMEENHVIEEETPEEEPEVPDNPEQANEELPLKTEESQDAIEEESQEAGPEKSKDDKGDDLPILEYNEQNEENKAKPEPFDESKAFDPSLSQPKFGVSTIVEPEVSERISQLVDKVNSSNASVQPKGNLVPSFDLAEIIRKKKENSNIDFKDEITKY